MKVCLLLLLAAAGGSAAGVTDEELWVLTEKLFDADVNAVGDQLTINLQGEGTSGDLATGPLFAVVPDSALSGTTIKLLRQVQDNYIPEITVAEVHTADDIAEQDALLDAMMNTQVMKLTETFLHDNGLLTGSLRVKLDEIWFTLYVRSGGKLGSSGFENTFVGELGTGEVIGLNNWVSFYTEEQKNYLDYGGWLRIIDLGTKGHILLDHFEWLAEPKASGTMFIGTSPELEMATYTVCFLARPDSLCTVQMDNQQFNIVTSTIPYNGKILVDSAYPEI
ncbi:endoribonuclease CG2145 [Procambarus clarkii]|uniref:endoribonuclease CG2145 n=1 Tax=Procambarus clarkii TaxID=6728 RepID=UPI0037444F59